MAATIIDGKSLAASVRAALKSRIDALAARGVRPGLAAILAGDDPASRVYVRNKARACEDTGVRSEVHEFPQHVSEAALLDRLAQLAALGNPLMQLAQADGAHPRPVATDVWVQGLLFGLEYRY